MTANRAVPPPTGGERAVVEGFLEFHRATLRAKCDGLSPDELARRSVPPSSLSLLGLVRHLADVEREWFLPFAGEEFRPLFDGGGFSSEGADAAPDTAVDAAFDAWDTAVAQSREVAASTSPDAIVTHPAVGQVSLRWVLVHMVEEYARHNGHADLLREAIDGSTGV